MNRDDLRRFAQRDWASAERGKLDYWSDRFRRDGAGPARYASTVLLEHARRLDAGYPSAAQRAADLAHHLEIRDRLDRAAGAFTSR